MIPRLPLLIALLLLVIASLLLGSSAVFGWLHLRACQACDRISYQCADAGFGWEALSAICLLAALVVLTCALILAAARLVLRSSRLLLWAERRGWPRLVRWLRARCGGATGPR